MNVPWRDRRGRFLPFKAAVLASLFVPGALYGFWLATGQLGGRPVMEVIHGTGLWAIRFLLISLAITPFARALDFPALLLVRRNVGVAAACYAVAHLSLYVVDQNFKLLTVISEIALRFYLTIGFVALLVLLALAVHLDRWMGEAAGTELEAAASAGLSGRGGGAAAFLHSVQAECFGAGVRLRPVRLADGVARGSRGVAAAAGHRLHRRAVRRSGGGVRAGTAGLEFAWYGLATKVNVWRVLYANETIERGLRPAHWVLVVTVSLVVIFVARRLIRTPAAGSAGGGLTRVDRLPDRSAGKVTRPLLY